MLITHKKHTFDSGVLIDKSNLLNEIRSPDKLINLLGRDPKLIKYLLGDVKLKQKYCRLPDDFEREMKETSSKLGLTESEFMALGVIYLLGVVQSGKREKQS